MGHQHSKRINSKSNNLGITVNNNQSLGVNFRHLSSQSQHRNALQTEAVDDQPIIEVISVAEINELREQRIQRVARDKSLAEQASQKKLNAAIIKFIKECSDNISFNITHDFTLERDYTFEPDEYGLGNDVSLKTLKEFYQKNVENKGWFVQIFRSTTSNLQELVSLPLNTSLMRLSVMHQ
jgi:hypothetical protein